jgi:hypothetical protein
VGEKRDRWETRLLKPILVLVEGQTEETFVREVLRQHLASLDLYVTPVVVATKRVKSGLKFWLTSKILVLFPICRSTSSRLCS